MVHLKQTAPMKRRLSAYRRLHAGTCLTPGRWLTRRWCKRPIATDALDHHIPPMADSARQEKDWGEVQWPQSCVQSRRTSLSSLSFRKNSPRPIHDNRGREWPFERVAGPRQSDSNVHVLLAQVERTRSRFS